MNRTPTVIIHPGGPLAVRQLRDIRRDPPRPVARPLCLASYLCLTPTDYSNRIRFGLGELDRVGDRLFMGRRPKPKSKTLNQLAELNEENRRLREIVAYLSEVVLTRIVGTTETSAEQSGSAET
jgi:hypothetical protein